MIDPGSRFGPYEILSKVGAGGMGEVYRAKDTRLDRTVAIKVLPSDHSLNAELRQRFEREARAVSSLNHPHICTLHDIGSENGTDYLVMEYIEGETLASRLQKGPLPLTELLRYSIQISDALEKAHRSGIVHRDLKPGNIMITKSGIKLLDFGLAKLQSEEQRSPDVSSLQTMQKDLTKDGVILGTIQYMSPEQLEGKEVDTRTDIFALGAVIYEMATGKKAFEGNSQASLIAAILKEEPKSISEQQPLTPSVLEKIVRICLAKDPDDRFQSVHDLKLQLQWITENSQPEKTQTKTASSKFTWPALIFGLLAGAGLIYFLIPKGHEIPLRKLQLAVPDSDTPSSNDFDISPNGKMVAYIRNNQLWVHDLEKLDGTEVANTEGADHLFWSPDSNNIGFTIGKKLWKVSNTGTGMTAIADLPDSFSRAGGAAWHQDQNIVFTTGFTGLLRVSSQGGDPSEFLKVESGEADFHNVSLLPDGRGLIFVAHRLAQGVDTIAIFDGKTRTTVLQQPGQRITSPVYSKTGHILYQRQVTNPGIWAMPFSIEKLQKTGEPFLVASDGVRPGVSDDGTLVFTRSDRWTPTVLVMRDRMGKIVNQIQKEPSLSQLPYPRLSPDGNQVLLPIRDAGKTNFWVFDIKNQTRRQLTFDNISSLWFCAWHPDGKQIAYSSGEIPKNYSVWSTSTDNVSDAKQLIIGSEAVYSPDGKFLMHTNTAEESLDLWFKNLETGESRPFLNSQYREVAPEFSPDGRYVAYVSDESRRNEVYVRSFPDGKSKWQISFNGGASPRWSGNTNELFFVEGNNIMVVSIKLKPVFDRGNAQILFTRKTVNADRAYNSVDCFDVSANGQHFVMLQDVDESKKAGNIPTINIVQNWFAEFKHK